MPADVIEEFTGSGSIGGVGGTSGGRIDPQPTERERNPFMPQPPQQIMPQPTLPGMGGSSLFPGLAQGGQMTPDIMGEIIRMIIGPILQRFFAGGMGMSQFGMGMGGGMEQPGASPGFELPNQPFLPRPQGWYGGMGSPMR